MVNINWKEQRKISDLIQPNNATQAVNSSLLVGTA